MKNSKPSNDTDRLRDLLSKNAKILSEEAAESGGKVSQSRLEDLDRLARLVEIRSAAEAPVPRSRWPIAVMLVITLVVVSLLLFARVPETEIELDLLLSEISFKLPEQQVLSGAMSLSTLGASGQEEIQFPRYGTTEATTHRASEGIGSAIRLAAAADDKQQGTLTLAAITVPDDTRVWLRPTGVAKQFRLTMNGKDLQLKADVNGPIEVALAGSPVRQLTFSSPEFIQLRAGSGALDLDLGFAALEKNTFAPQLSATDISLFRIDNLIDDQRTVIRKVSTVLSGALYFESLGGKELRLRPGEEIRFDSSQGRIRTIALNDDHISFAFHGKVRGMTTGGSDARSLMPTWLEWLHARHSLSLLWGTTLYVLGLIISIRGWWRGSR